MAISEIAKTAAEGLSAGMESKSGNFEVPGTQDMTEKAAGNPEGYNAQEIRDNCGDIPNEAENTNPIIQAEGEGSEVKPIKNKIEGLRREDEVEDELRGKYPESEGYTIQSEVYLRDKEGNIVKDPVTGEARRVDFVVTDKDGNAVDSIEVTSKTADKIEQSAKEERIRENGGNYIKTSDGNLARIPDEVHTRIERRD